MAEEVFQYLSKTPEVRVPLGCKLGHHKWLGPRKKEEFHWYDDESWKSFYFDTDVSACKKCGKVEEVEVMFGKPARYLAVSNHRNVYFKGYTNPEILKEPEIFEKLNWHKEYLKEKQRKLENKRKEDKTAFDSKKILLEEKFEKLTPKLMEQGYKIGKHSELYVNKKLLGIPHKHSVANIKVLTYPFPYPSSSVSFNSPTVQGDAVVKVEDKVLFSQVKDDVAGFLEELGFKKLTIRDN